MTKKATAAALALIAALALCGTASARPLSSKAARTLATRLAKKQIGPRHIIAAEVSRQRRVSSAKIVFRYADRSSAHVFCTARIAVVARGNHLHAGFGRKRCKGIPAEALAIEAATLRARSAVAARAAAVKSSLAFFARSLEPCSRLRVPARARGAVALIVSVGATEAVESPLTTQTADFVAALSRIGASDHTFAMAIAAWQDYRSSVASLPPLADACQVIRSWAAKGYSPTSPPLDLGALDALRRRIAADAAVIANGSRRLANDGIFVRAVIAFNPEGLLLGAHRRALTIGR